MKKTTAHPGGGLLRLGLGLAVGAVAGYGIVRRLAEPSRLPHLARTDDVIFAALPPTIAWERSTTLGRGGDCCDFRWRRVHPG